MKIPTEGPFRYAETQMWKVTKVHLGKKKAFHVENIFILSWHAKLKIKMLTSVREKIF